MLDFNESEVPGEQGGDAIAKRDAQREANREDVRAALLARLESVLATLFPAGKRKRGKFYIGDVLGSPGDSLEIVLDGDPDDIGGIFEYPVMACNAHIEDAILNITGHLLGPE